MKFNWGVGIFSFYGLFVIFMLMMVYKSCNTKVDLVSNDYYEQELKFQEVIDKKYNVTTLEKGLEYKLEGSTVFLTFPKKHQSAEGTVFLFRPSDKNLDKKFIIELDTNSQMSVTADNSPPGLYVLKVDWSNDSIGYYVEEDIYLSK